MAEEPSTTLPSLDISCLSRVQGPSLDSRKNWYVLTTEVCRSRRLKDFAKSVSNIFPDDIRTAPSRELQPSTFLRGYSRQPSSVYMVSTLSLFVGLLRQKEIALDDLIRSPVFVSVARIVNSIALDLVPQEAKDIDFAVFGSSAAAQCPTSGERFFNRIP